MSCRLQSAVGCCLLPCVSEHLGAAHSEWLPESWLWLQLPRSRPAVPGLPEGTGLASKKLRNAFGPVTNA